jgi:hypothetical protein
VFCLPGLLTPAILKNLLSPHFIFLSATATFIRLILSPPYPLCALPTFLLLTINHQVDEKEEDVLLSWTRLESILATQILKMSPLVWAVASNASPQCASSSTHWWWWCCCWICTTATRIIPIIYPAASIPSLYLPLSFLALYCNSNLSANIFYSAFNTSQLFSPQKEQIHQATQCDSSKFKVSVIGTTD